MKTADYNIRRSRTLSDNIQDTFMSASHQKDILASLNKQMLFMDKIIPCLILFQQIFICLLNLALLPAVVFGMFWKQQSAVGKKKPAPSGEAPAAAR